MLARVEPSLLATGCSLPLLPLCLPQICWHLYPLRGIKVQPSPNGERQVGAVLREQRGSCGSPSSLQCCGEQGKQLTPPVTVLRGEPIASQPAANPRLLPRCPSLGTRHGWKPGSAENWRAKLRSEVPGGASSAFPVASIAPKLPCPGCSRPAARGAVMPRAATAPGLGPPPGRRRKQNKTGLGVNII